ncbi:1491_t:CDS:2 [Funneliformis geosporum]|uniref:1491_t:CDS:1 n=1 Tax=Funneliformis geosporum TaxID=1117311 RepID=A0A9W4SGP9_9GLOM|nr:1491_t:CDS:2 [Funneliformis geosporum]
MTITGKKQLTERISRQTKITQTQVGKIIEELLTETKKALIKGEEVKFLGYFSFKTTLTKPRIAMNLQTNKKMKVPAKRELINELKKRVQNDTLQVKTLPKLEKETKTLFSCLDSGSLLLLVGLTVSFTFLVGYILKVNTNSITGVSLEFSEQKRERGEEQTFLQPITYLLCQEVLKKENIILFNEKFQTGLASPILPSLTGLIKKHGDHLDSFFSQIPDINNPLILAYLEKLTKKYANSFGFEVQYQAQKRKIKSEDPHLHILSDKEKDFLEKQLKRYCNRRKLAEYLNNFEICQMSLDEEEGRAIGIIRQINNSTKHPERNYLF